MAKHSVSLGMVQSIVGSGLYAVDDNKKGKFPLPGKPLVALGRFYGTPDIETAILLSERLAVPLYDRKLLAVLSKVAKGDKHLLERLDERVTSLVDDMVHAFFSKKSTNKDTYFRYMAKIILGIGPTGGVIVGRAAHLLLPERAAFRVRLEGSVKVCTKRLMATKSLKKGEAEREIKKTNKERDKFNKEVAKRYPSRIDHFDLILNTDLYSPEQMVRIITVAMQEAGFQVPESKPAP